MAVERTVGKFDLDFAVGSAYDATNFLALRHLQRESAARLRGGNSWRHEFRKAVRRCFGHSLHVIPCPR
jgi:hypothetical protein